MALDIHLVIPENSAAARAVKRLADAEHISTEEAAGQLLAKAAQMHGRKTPAEEMWGAFSDPNDAAMLDEIVGEAYLLRLSDQPRNVEV